jgi:hypothetical protein
MLQKKKFLQAIGGWKKIRSQKNCPTPPPQISNGPSLRRRRTWQFLVWGYLGQDKTARHEALSCTRVLFFLSSLRTKFATNFACRKTKTRYAFMSRCFVCVKISFHKQLDWYESIITPLRRTTIANPKLQNNYIQRSHFCDKNSKVVFTAYICPSCS